MGLVSPGLEFGRVLSVHDATGEFLLTWAFLFAGDFVTNIKLGTGRHEYKFIVDSEWRHDPTQPVTSNAFGQYFGLDSYALCCAGVAYISLASLQLAPGACVTCVHPDCLQLTLCAFNNASLPARRVPI